MAEKKEHNHVVGDERRVVQYDRDKGLDTGASVPRGRETFREEWVAEDGIPRTVVGYSGGKVDEFRGHDQKNYWRVEQRKRDLIAKARSLRADDRSSREAWKSLMDEWKAAGNLSKAENDKLWREFDSVRQSYRRDVERLKEKRAADQRAAKAAKERLIVKAKSIKADDRSSRDQWRSLMDDWKRAGNAGREENDRLWGQLKSTKDAYHRDVTRQKEKRASEWASAKATKERLVSRARTIRADDRSSRDQWRSLMDEWKQAGSAGKADNDRLWDQLKSIKDAYHKDVERQKEQRRVEMRQRAQEIRRRGYELEERSRQVNEQALRVRVSPGYQGRDFMKAAESNRRKSEKAGALEAKASSMYRKAQELKAKADDIERKIR